MDQLRAMARGFGAEPACQVPLPRKTRDIPAGRRAPGGATLASPLLLTPANQTGTGVLSAPCRLGVKPAVCQLDTGAAASLIQDSADSEAFPVVGHGAISGASGQPQQVSSIKVPDVAVGGMDFGPRIMARVPGGFGQAKDEPALIGIDTLSSELDSLQFDFAANQLRGNAPASGPAYKLYRSGEGHLILPLAVNGLKGMGLWDTGASITVVDPDFVKQHPENFKVAGHTQIRDIGGTAIPADVYVAQSTKIGEYDFQGVVMVGVAAPDFFASFKERGLAPMIIGYNIITRANWTMDFKRARWSLSQPRPANPAVAGDASKGTRTGALSFSGEPVRLPENIRVRVPKGRITIQ